MGSSERGVRVNERATYQMSLPMSGPVSQDVIERCRHVGEAIRLSMQVAMLDQKQVYLALKMDKGHWSRVMSGELSFPADRLEDFIRLVGNTIVLQYLAFRFGLGLYTLESEQQRQIRERDDRINEQARKIQYLEELITGRGNA